MLHTLCGRGMTWLRQRMPPGWSMMAVLQPLTLQLRFLAASTLQFWKTNPCRNTSCMFESCWQRCWHDSIGFPEDIAVRGWEHPIHS